VEVPGSVQEQTPTLQLQTHEQVPQALSVTKELMQELQGQEGGQCREVGVVLWKVPEW
jgi:hypothetical protein